MISLFKLAEMKLMEFTMSGIRAYTISKASNDFMKRYPKRWIAASISRNDVSNVDDLRDLKYGTDDIDYLFTHDKASAKNINTFYDFWAELFSAPMTSKMNVTPFNGHNYFIGDEDGSNLIIKISPKNKSVDPRLMNSIVIRNTCEFMMNVDFKKSITKLLKDTYNETYLKSIDTTEKWLISLLNELPMDLYHHALEFPDIITDRLFKQPLNLDLGMFVIGYTMRTDMKTELSMIRELESQLCPKNRRQIIYENYNGIAERIMNEAKKRHMKYRYEPGKWISIKICDLQNLPIDYTITDYMH